MSPRARAALVATIGIAAAVAIAVVWRGWSGRGGSGVAGVTVGDDVRVVQEVLGSDPARVILHDVDQAIDAERPVMAAELIEQAALPAIDRHVRMFEDARVGTQEGRAFRTRAVRIHRARRAAIGRYGRALSRGIGSEDEELLDALEAYGEAERDIMVLHDDLAAIRPLAPEALEREQERIAPTLGDHPAIRRGEGETDDDAEPPRPEGEPDIRLGEPTEPLPEH